MYKVILFLLGLNFFTARAGDSIRIPYGEKGELHYDLKKGVFAVYDNHRLIFSDVAATVRANGQPLSSTTYTQRSFKKETINDRFGKGVKYLVSLTAAGRPQMTQAFYTYPDRDYFLTEVRVSGRALESNYMSPFDGVFAPVTGDARTLFVPFDNDTFISYDAKPLSGDKPNTSAEAGVVYDNDTRNGWVVGSVEHMVWKTGVRDSAGRITAWGGYTDPAVNRDHIPHGSIRGKELKSPLLLVGYFADWRAGLEAYGQANRTNEPPYVFNWTGATPVGWNSWGVLQDHITYDKVIRVADFFADSLRGFRVGGTAFIDLDSSGI